MRSPRNKISRREFAKLLGRAGIALSIPRAVAGPDGSGPILLKNAAPACGLDFC